MSFRLTRAVLVAATLAFLAGCGGSRFAPATPGAPLQSAERQTSPFANEFTTKKPPPLIFASAEGSFSQAGYFCAYNNTGTNQSPDWCQTGSPLKEPNGLWVDATNNLYVSDASGSIFEYNVPTGTSAPGQPNFTYTDSTSALGPQESDAAVVCGNYVYASNTAALTGSKQYLSFTVWSVGKAKPLEVITTTNYANAAVSGGSAAGIACDTSDNVLFEYSISYDGPGFVDEWSAQDGTKKPVFIKTLPAGSQTGIFEGLAVSSKNVLTMGNPFYTITGTEEVPVIEFFTETSSKPSHVCSSKVKPALSEPVGMAYAFADKALWVADLGNNTLYELNYSTCTTKNTITKGNGGAAFPFLAGVSLSPNGIP